MMYELAGIESMRSRGPGYSLADGHVLQHVAADKLQPELLLP